MNRSPESCALVVVAAGAGLRFGADGPKALPKALQPLAGRPLLAHGILAAASVVDEIVVVVAAAARAAVARVVGELPLTVELVEGGADRQASVAAGLRACRSRYALIHDAARPLVRAEDFRRVRQALETVAAAVLAAPCTDTVKESADGTMVTATRDRQQLWLAQTPQGVDRVQALDLLARAEAAGFRCTDDVGLFEWAGEPVRLVPGSRENVKITYPVDLTIAEAILRQRHSASADDR